MPMTIGLPQYRMEAVEESKNYLLTEPVPYEFRTTVVRGLHTEEGRFFDKRLIQPAHGFQDVFTADPFHKT